MPDWQERIDRHTHPAIHVEHVLRYRIAVPAIRAGAVWCDLGCGHGIAAADALAPEGFGGRAVLVDAAEEAVQTAAAELAGSAAETVPLVADLASADGIATVTEALGEGTGAITCFEVVEHLETFVPLLEALVGLRDRFTVFLSVPNDAFWAIENPHHRTTWGEGAFEELRRLLPPGHVLARQAPLQGSAIVPLEPSGAAELDVPVRATAEGTPSHLLAGFGPRARDLAAQAVVAQADLAGQRRWERQRESDLAFFQTVSAEVDDYRAYIQQLERELGRRPAAESEPAA